MPFKAITLLGSTIYYPFNCQAYIAMGDENLENMVPIYNDISKVSKITVNYSNGTKKEYTNRDIYDANDYYMDDFYFSSKEIPILYNEGMLIINMQDSHVKIQIESIEIVEDEVSQKYEVGSNTMVMSYYASN